MKYADFKKKSSFSKEELLAMSWGTLVEDPPHREFLALPAPPMLMLDRVLSIEHAGPRGRLVAEKDIVVDDWHFQCHFRSDPVMPGCLGVDAIWQLLGLDCCVRGARGLGRALGCQEVMFQGQIRPYNKVVRYEIEVRRYVELEASGASMIVGTGKVLVDGEHVYTIRDAKVGVFLGIQYPDYPNRSKNSVGGIMGHE